MDEQYVVVSFILSGVTIYGPRLDRVVFMGESPTKRAFNSQYISKSQTVMVMLTQLHIFNLSIILLSHIHILVHLYCTLIRYVSFF